MMKTLKNLIAGMTLTLAATAAYATDFTWNTEVKIGNWNDTNNWLVAGAATDAFPSGSGDTATFPAGGAATVTLTAGYTLGAMTVDTSESANWRFDGGTGDRAINVTPTITGDGTGNVLFKRVSTGSGSTMKSGALTVSSAPKAISFDSNCGWSFNNMNLPNTRVNLLRHGAIKGGWTASTFGDLAVYGENYLYADAKAEFGSFVDLGGVACVEVKSGTLKFRNTAGIKLVGGTQTLAAGGSQIPVAPQFALAANSTDYAKVAVNCAQPIGMCTLDADSTIKEIPTSTMKSSFANAGELDNVYISEATTLDRDLTVNAVVYSANINLGGHTLTVKSGVFRPATKFNYCEVSNGKVVTCEPMLISDGGNNANERLKCEFETSGNDDPEKAMFTYVTVGGAVPQTTSNTNVIGAIQNQNGATPLYSAGLGAPTVFREISDSQSMSFGNHYMVVKGAGIGGNGGINATQKFNPRIELGDLGEVASENYNLYVGDGAVLAPGSVAEDGYRRGILQCCYRTGNLNGFEYVKFLPGSTFKTVLRADGTATKLECVYGGYGIHYSQVTLGGDLEIAEANRCPGGATWIVLSTGREIVGQFANVTEGYTVQYNVDLGTDANGIQLYGVQVTKNAQPVADNTVAFTENEPAYDFTTKSLRIGGTVTKIGDEADYVKATIEYGATAELGGTIEQTTALGKGEAYAQVFDGPFAGAQKFYYRVTLTSNLKITKTGELHEFLIPVELKVAAPVYDRSEGTITVSATADAAAAATLFYGETAELGSSEALGSFAAGEAMAKTFGGYEPAQALYYQYSLVDANGTVTTSSVCQAIMPANGELVGVSAVTTNTQITISTEVAARGLGTVTLNFYVGPAAGNMTLVGSRTLAEGDPDVQSFAYTIGAEGNYYYAAELVNEYLGETWTTRVTSDKPTAVADASPYVWKGGEGRWDDPAMWAGDVGAIGKPNANSDVYVKPEAASVVTLSEMRTVGKLYLSTAKAPVTLKGATIAAANIYMDKAEDAQALTLDGCVLGTKNAASALKVAEFADHVSKLTLANGAGILLNSDMAGADVTLFNENWLQSSAAQNAGVLTATRGFSKLTGKWNFESFASGGKVAVVGVESGNVTFADASGVMLVNGVAPEFALAAGNGWANNRYGWGICTVDGDGAVRAIPTEALHEGLAGATATDNVYLTANATLDADMTVNAIVFADGVTLDLGGHTLTVKSGVVRPYGNFGYTVQNGTLAVERPFMTFDTVNNSTVRLLADVVYTGSGKGEIAFNSQGGSRPTATQLAGFYGTAYAMNSWTPSTAVSSGLTVEFANGSLGTAGHGCTYVFGGLAGSFGIAAGQFHQVYWIGSTNGVDNLRERTHRVVLADGGTLAFGGLDANGLRHGAVKLTPSQNDLYGISYFEMRGGTLEATVYADGEATYLDATGATAWPDTKGIAVTLGGDLKVIAPEKASEGTVWTVVKTQREVIGYFKNAGEDGQGIPGYRVAYNVKQPDGTYAVTVTRRPPGMMIFVR